MKVGDFEQVQSLIGRRQELVDLLGQVPSMTAHAIEMKTTEGVVVFSNEQPGAQHKLSANVSPAMRDALTVGLYADLAALDSELRALGVEPPADPAPAEMASARKR